MTDAPQNDFSAAGENPSTSPKAVKLRCPYCTHVFEPHKGASCPHCKRVMNIPSTYRSEPRHHRKLSLFERRKLSGGTKGSAGLGSKLNTLLMSRQRTRIMIWVVFAFFLLGYLLVRQASRQVPIFAAGPGRQTPEERTIEDLQNLQVALELFKEHCGRYPTTAEGLKALERQPGYRQWKGPYIIRLLPDGWKNPYHYVYSNASYTLFSAGPDGLAGTPDDIAPLNFSSTNPPPMPIAEPTEPDEPPTVTIKP